MSARRQITLSVDQCREVGIGPGDEYRSFGKESGPDGEVIQWARDSMATLMQDVGVDHGGADVGVPQQGLDGANVRTPL